MILNDIALLSSNTPRTKAYIQMMIRESLLPSLCVLYTNDYESMVEESDSYVPDYEYDFFDLNEPVLYTIKKANLDYVVVDNKDINSDEMKACIEGLPQKYLVYSGYGGYILKDHLFHLGKKYIHVHAGKLPQYRGSTTAYYSILQEDKICATAIFLSEGIDEGEIILFEEFPCPGKGTNIDTLYEPYLRGEVLKSVLKEYSKTGEFSAISQDTRSAQTYFIIHPVLKHIALMRK